MKLLKSSTLLFLLAITLICFENFKNLFTLSFIVLTTSIIFVTLGLTKINIDRASSNEAKFPHKTKNKLS